LIHNNINISKNIAYNYNNDILIIDLSKEPNNMFNLLMSNWTIENYMIFVWLGIFIVAILIEYFTYEIVSIWFAGGAFIAFISSFIPHIPYWCEIIIFISFSILLLILLRPVAKKLLFRKEIKSNIEEIIGKKVLVSKRITELDCGEVKINGVIWRAMSNEPIKSIEKGEIVKIVAIDGNELIVKKID